MIGSNPRNGVLVTAQVGRCGIEIKIESSARHLAQDFKLNEVALFFFDMCRIKQSSSRAVSSCMHQILTQLQHIHKHLHNCHKTDTPSKQERTHINLHPQHSVNGSGQCGRMAELSPLTGYDLQSVQGSSYSWWQSCKLLYDHMSRTCNISRLIQPTLGKT